jgi:chlorobactene glucosyltransferase
MNSLLLIILAFLAIRLVVALFNLATLPWMPSKPRQHDDKVSVLIPARNEEKCLPDLCNNLKNLAHENLEIILLDDESTDKTYERARAHAKGFSSFSVLKGKPLPPGWLGKNWACHQLSQAALGDYFLFIDADVELHPDAINSGLQEVKSKNLALLSCFPDQIMKSTGEKLVVPIMHYILLSLLPLRMVYWSNFSSLSAANGQFMLFQRKYYWKWHEKVKDKIVEDICIMRAIKQTSLKGEVLLGNRMVKCRMYHSFQDALNGFSKNILAGFNNHFFSMWVFFFITYFGYILFALYPDGRLIALAIAAIVLLRVMISLVSRQAVWRNLFMHVAQMPLMVYIGTLSCIKKQRKKNTWKGRKI